MINFIKLLESEDLGYAKAAIIVNKIESAYKSVEVERALDDLFSKKNRMILKNAKNISFLETLACCYCWLRLHRGSIYRKLGDTWRVEVSKLQKVINVLVLVKRICGAVKIIPFFEFFCYCCLSNYNKAFKCIEGCDFPENAYKAGFFLGVKTAIPQEDFLYGLHTKETCMSEYFSESSLSNQLKSIRNRIVREDNEYEVIFLVSCTVNYYMNFALDFVKSLNESAENPLVIFVLIDREEEIKSVGEDLRVSESRGDFSLVLLESDVFDLPSLSATLRFLIAPYIIEEFNSSVVVCDIDSTFTHDNYNRLREKTECFQSTDIGLPLNVYGRSRIPWSSVPAALCYFPDSVNSLFYLGCVQQYFNATYRGKEKNWWIDQNALYGAIVAYREVFKTNIIINLIDEKKLVSDNYKDQVISFKQNNRKSH